MFNEITDRCLVLERLVDTLGLAKDKVVGKLLVKQFLVMDQIKVVVNKLLLESSIVALNIRIDLRTARIREQMRDKGSATLNQDLVCNVGTCRPDDKGETQVRGAHESESTDAGHRDGPSRSSVEVSAMGMERRGWIIWPYYLLNQKWEEPDDKARGAGEGDGMIRGG